MRLEKSRLENESLRELARLDHYPDVTTYPGMMEILFRVLERSGDRRARTSAAVALGNGFSPTTVVEQFLAERLPLESDNIKVGPAIIRTLSHLAISAKRAPSKASQDAILNSISSSKWPIRRVAVRAVEALELSKGRKHLLDNIPLETDSRTLDSTLGALRSLGVADSETIKLLEAHSKAATDQNKKQKIQLTIEALQALNQN